MLDIPISHKDVNGSMDVTSSSQSTKAAALIERSRVSSSVSCSEPRTSFGMTSGVTCSEKSSKRVSDDIIMCDLPQSCAIFVTMVVSETSATQFLTASTGNNKTRGINVSSFKLCAVQKSIHERDICTSSHSSKSIAIMTSSVELLGMKLS